MGEGSRLLMVSPEVSTMTEAPMRVVSLLACPNQALVCLTTNSVALPCFYEVPSRGEQWL